MSKRLLEEQQFAVDAASVTVKHTRSCDGRHVCSCQFRFASQCFLNNLWKKRVKKAKIAHVFAHAAPRPTLESLHLPMKALITQFLTAREIAVLSMVNKQFQREANILAEETTRELIENSENKDKVLSVERETKSWSLYMHMQMNCVYKLLVYYTGYKTGKMRQDFPHWAFGVVTFDPNEPYRKILPNTWKFHEFQPWMRQRSNGKGGEWVLRKNFRGVLPPNFRARVTEWAQGIRVGSLLTVAYLNAGSAEPAWWEAQVWYVWRAGGRQAPARVFDALNDSFIEVEPDDLEDHLKQNPLHVIDVTTCKRLCRVCEKKNKTFYECHVEKGHPMI